MLGSKLIHVSKSAPLETWAIRQLRCCFWTPVSIRRNLLASNIEFWSIVSWVGTHAVVTLPRYNNCGMHLHPLWVQWHSAHCYTSITFTLRWRHNGRDSVSNHEPHHCLLNRLFRRRSRKTSKLRVTGLCVGNSPGTGEFPAQIASNAEMFPFDNVIMQHVLVINCTDIKLQLKPFTLS